MNSRAWLIAAGSHIISVRSFLICMFKKIFLGTLVFALIGVGVYLLYSFGKEDAATKDRVYRVGVLSGIEFFAATTDGFKAGMADLGYVEGEHITYDVRTPAGYVGNQDLIQEFIDSEVDLILVFPTEASIEAKEVAEDTGIPVLFANAIVEGNGLIESIQRPGGNVTGARFTGPENAVSRFEILHELVPEAKRFFVPFEKGYPTVAPALDALRPLAEAKGITLVEGEFKNPGEAIGYFDTLTQSGEEPPFDAVLAIAEPLMVIPDVTAAFYSYAHERKIPIAGSSILNDAYGPIFSFSPNSYNTGKLVAASAHKILKGTPAGTIPVLTPEGDLQINYKMIQALGIEISEGLLSKASRIVR